MNAKRRLVGSYQQERPESNFDAIIIGSGIGGLAAGALLARHGGKRVLVLERHYVAGGYTHTFHRPGYEWDVGVHYIGQMYEGAVLRALFDEITDGELKWADLGNVYDRVIIGDTAFDFCKGKESLCASLKKRFPSEAAAIDSYFTLVEKSVKSTFSFFKASALPPWFDILAGSYLRRDFLGFANQTTRQVLESLTKDQQLIGLLTAQFGDYGLTPAESSFAVHAMVVNHYLKGGYYPIGGAGRIAETIIPLINNAGGKVLINAEVAEIVVENGRARGVRMADGAIVRAPLIISDAGALNTYLRLLPTELRAKLKLKENLRAVRPSLAHLCLYIGLKSTARQLALPRANLWLYPNAAHEQNLKAAMENIEAPFPLVYVSFPSAKDPDFERRHPGRATIDVITVASYEHFAQWQDSKWQKRGEDYQAFKMRLADRLLEALFQHVPQARQHLDYYELSTPLTTRHFCNYPVGEIYGLDHTPIRFHQKLLRPRTPIRGLYLAGQDVALCGVAGALMGGVLSASAILGCNLVSAIASKRLSKRNARAAISRA
jgi:all-trans-retinol 13,14-reductase